MTVPVKLFWGRSLNPEDGGGLTADGRGGRTYDIRTFSNRTGQDPLFSLAVTEPTLGGKMTARIGELYHSDEHAKDAALAYEKKHQAREGE